MKRILLCTTILTGLIANLAFAGDNKNQATKADTQVKYNCSMINQHYPFALPELPYGEKALEPYTSSLTLRDHYYKLQNAFIGQLNQLVKDTPLQSKSMEDLIMLSYKDPSKLAIYESAAMAWNHSFFWCSMKKNGGGKPTGAIAAKINQDFGSYENFSSAFKDAANNEFGSGWAWLVLDENNKLAVIRTDNADLPMIYNKKALLTIDVWEHAYYLDVQYLRPNYVESFLDHLANWDFVNQKLQEAQKSN